LGDVDVLLHFCKIEIREIAPPGKIGKLICLAEGKDKAVVEVEWVP
jgi:hypothetical protein